MRSLSQSNVCMTLSDYPHLSNFHGHLILRDSASISCDWDAPLLKEWRDSLWDLWEVNIPRMYTLLPMSAMQRKEMFDRHTMRR